MVNWYTVREAAAAPQQEPGVCCWLLRIDISALEHAMKGIRYLGAREASSRIRR